MAIAEQLVQCGILTMQCNRLDRKYRIFMLLSFCWQIPSMELVGCCLRSSKQATVYIIWETCLLAVVRAKTKWTSNFLHALYYYNACKIL
jgi:hypothetical protein